MAERTLGVVLFPGFELLDVFGPLEAFGGLGGLFNVVTVAERAGPVASAQRVRAVADHGLADCPHLDLLARRAAEAEIVTSVCTGAALLARAGLLDGRRATTNKAFFQWVADQGPRVTWVKVARWVDDGKFVTSSGVSAGIDMALHVIARTHGREVSENVARAMEYDWHTDADWDPFAKVWGLA